MFDLVLYSKDINEDISCRICYLHDILLTIKKGEEQLKTLMQVAKKLSEARFTVNSNKWEYGLKTSKKKLRQSTKAQNLKILNYCSLYPYSSMILKLTYNLLNKNKKFEWNTECKQAFGKA